DIRLFIHRPRGLLNDKVLERLVSILGDLEATSKEPFDRFTDTLEADAVDLNFRPILKVSLFRRLTYEVRPEVKSAMLATDSTIIQYAELHKLMTEGSRIEFQIFQDRRKAAEWLGVPLERLEDRKATERVRS